MGHKGCRAEPCQAPPTQAKRRVQGSFWAPKTWLASHHSSALQTDVSQVPVTLEAQQSWAKRLAEKVKKAAMLTAFGHLFAKRLSRGFRSTLHLKRMRASAHNFHMDFILDNILLSILSLIKFVIIMFDAIMTPKIESILLIIISSDTVKFLLGLCINWCLSSNIS